VKERREGEKKEVRRRKEDYVPGFRGNKFPWSLFIFLKKAFFIGHK